MEVLFLIILLLIVGVGAIGVFLIGSSNHSIGLMLAGFFLIAFGIALCGCYIAAKDKERKEPTALDVYRGKTTLEITYRDSVPVDSVVVFKTKR